MQSNTSTTDWLVNIFDMLLLYWSIKSHSLSCNQKAFWYGSRHVLALQWVVVICPLSMIAIIFKTLIFLDYYESPGLIQHGEMLALTPNWRIVLLKSHWSVGTERIGIFGWIQGSWKNMHQDCFLRLLRGEKLRGPDETAPVLKQCVRCGLASEPLVPWGASTSVDTEDWDVIGGSQEYKYERNLPTPHHLCSVLLVVNKLPKPR